MSAREVRRQTCNESRPWSDRLLIKPSERAEPASPPAIDGHINCKASADPHRSTGLRSRVTQESRPQPRRHQLCKPAPGQPARALQVTHGLADPQPADFVRAAQTEWIRAPLSVEDCR